MKYKSQKTKNGFYMEHERADHLSHAKIYTAKMRKNKSIDLTKSKVILSINHVSKSPNSSPYKDTYTVQNSKKLNRLRQKTKKTKYDEINLKARNSSFIHKNHLCTICDPSKEKSCDDEEEHITFKRSDKEKHYEVNPDARYQNICKHVPISAIKGKKHKKLPYNLDSTIFDTSSQIECFEINKLKSKDNNKSEYSQNVPNSNDGDARTGERDSSCFKKHKNKTRYKDPSQQNFNNEQTNRETAAQAETEIDLDFGSHTGQFLTIKPKKKKKQNKDKSLKYDINKKETNTDSNCQDLKNTDGNVNCFDYKSKRINKWIDNGSNLDIYKLSEDELISNKNEFSQELNINISINLEPNKNSNLTGNIIKSSKNKKSKNGKKGHLSEATPSHYFKESLSPVEFVSLENLKTNSLENQTFKKSKNKIVFKDTYLESKLITGENLICNPITETLSLYGDSDTQFLFSPTNSPKIHKRKGNFIDCDKSELQNSLNINIANNDNCSKEKETKLKEKNSPNYLEQSSGFYSTSHFETNNLQNSLNTEENQYFKKKNKKKTKTLLENNVMKDIGYTNMLVEQDFKHTNTETVNVPKINRKKDKTERNYIKLPHIHDVGYKNMIVEVDFKHTDAKSINVSNKDEVEMIELGFSQKMDPKKDKKEMSFVKLQQNNKQEKSLENNFMDHLAVKKHKNKKKDRSLSEIDNTKKVGKNLGEVLKTDTHIRDSFIPDELNQNISNNKNDLDYLEINTKNNSSDKCHNSDAAEFVKTNTRMAVDVLQEPALNSYNNSSIEFFFKEKNNCINENAKETRDYDKEEEDKWGNKSINTEKFDKSYREEKFKNDQTGVFRQSRKEQDNEELVLSTSTPQKYSGEKTISCSLKRKNDKLVRPYTSDDSEVDIPKKKRKVTLVQSTLKGFFKTKLHEVRKEVSSLKTKDFTDRSNKNKKLNEQEQMDNVILETRSIKNLQSADCFITDTVKNIERNDLHNDQIEIIEHYVGDSSYMELESNLDISEPFFNITEDNHNMLQESGPGKDNEVHLKAEDVDQEQEVWNHSDRDEEAGKEKIKASETFTTSDSDVELSDSEKSVKEKKKIKKKVNEGKKKLLRNLNLDVDFDVPPLHEIFPQSTALTAAARKTIKKRGLSMKSGKFSLAEDKKLRANWNNFVKKFNITDSPTEYFDLNTNFISKEEKKVFLFHIGRGLCDRNLGSVFKRFKRMFTEKEKGKYERFTKREDNIILKMMKKTHRKGNYIVEIAEKLNRTKTSVENRIARLQEGQTRKIRWKCRNIAAFIEHLMKVTKCTKVQQLKNRKFSTDEWIELSDALDRLPVRRLKETWYTIIHPRLFMKENFVSLKYVKTTLIKALYENHEKDWTLVDWNKYVPLFEGFTSLRLYYLLHDVVKTKVPKEKKGNLRACLKILYGLVEEDKLTSTGIITKIRYENGKVYEEKDP